MEKRIYYGVDLNRNFAELIRKSANSTEYNNLIAKRNFKIGCFVRERDWTEGMIVVDRDHQAWIIEKIEGNKIEEMTLHVKNGDGTEKVFDAIDVVDITEVELDNKFLALKFAILAACGIYDDAPQVKIPGWFNIVDYVQQMERDSWDNTNLMGVTE